MNFYEKELQSIEKSGRFRQRKIFDKDLIDLASNDYLGLAAKKELFDKAYELVSEQSYYGAKASMLVNGYSEIHKQFEDRLCEVNGFESGLVVGSGFLANISMIESMIRKKDVLILDEEYHASGMLASKLVENVITFKHNDVEDLEQKLQKIKANRIIIAIEGVYSMHGDIAPKEINQLAKQYGAILIVDEAHSSGVLGDSLLGWYDFHNIIIEPHHIKMGTLGKAYGSYGAYILASKHIVTFLENRAKAIIYTTAPSQFDMAYGLVAFEYIIKNKDILKEQLTLHKKIVKEYLGVDSPSSILPIVINDNKKVLELQKRLMEEGFLVGAIRQPTVKEAILRVILKLDVDSEQLKLLMNKIKDNLDSINL
jgi:8-amino-7-oxononanoate synthase